MAIDKIADSLVDLCRNAQREVVLIAPFIKADVITRLVAETPAGVAITCITRWRPEEIAAGISDLEVWDVIRTLPAAALFLRHNLHAKYFRGDSRRLVGSANLTATALGWSQRPNLELLIPVSPEIVAGFEEDAKANTVRVDDTLHATMAKAVAALKDPPRRWGPVGRTLKLPDSAVAADLGTWIPSCRTPEKLYAAYLNKRAELIEEVYDAAVQDLAALDIPSGLDLPAFELVVAAMLQQMPLVKKVDDVAVTPQSFDDLVLLLRAELGNKVSVQFDAVEAWQTLVRWLKHFFRDRYKTESRTQEFFFRPEFTEA